MNTVYTVSKCPLSWAVAHNWPLSDAWQNGHFFDLDESEDVLLETHWDARNWKCLTQIWWALLKSACCCAPNSMFILRPLKVETLRKLQPTQWGWWHCKGATRKLPCPFPHMKTQHSSLLPSFYFFFLAFFVLLKPDSLLGIFYCSCYSSWFVLEHFLFPSESEV